ncbi:3'-5' exonuclease [Hyphococcus flavus]|uniref:3'-5' exonuclease n=1 Tax=Hyphococcus flavus TaxID=1866326 RepID=A0AAF0CBU6_9PROT|nr:3'-5' exonuclease [Hyphococcus flavus]WDI31870.1 3'-5' exonuclease [Hyphococcus flavus]
MSSARDLFVSVDVETSGPIPGEFSLLSIGACNIEDDRQTFECELKPITDRADPKALAISGFSMEELVRIGSEPETAMKNFASWLQVISDGDRNLVFVGFNAPFDWSFINYYFHRFLGKNPFGFAALDIKALYMGTTGCAWAETKSSLMTEALRPRRRGDHNALSDALFQAELFRLTKAST